MTIIHCLMTGKRPSRAFNTRRPSVFGRCVEIFRRANNNIVIRGFCLGRSQRTRPGAGGDERALPNTKEQRTPPLRRASSCVGRRGWTISRPKRACEKRSGGGGGGGDVRTYVSCARTMYNVSVWFSEREKKKIIIIRYTHFSSPYRRTWWRTRVLTRVWPYAYHAGTRVVRVSRRDPRVGPGQKNTWNACSASSKCEYVPTADETDNVFFSRSLRGDGDLYNIIVVVALQQRFELTDF